MKVDLYRVVKRTVLTEKYNIEHEKRDFFVEYLHGCELHENKKRYPDWIFWKKNDVILFQQDLKKKDFYINYSKIWQILEVKYGMDSQQIRTFTQNLLLTPVKLEAYTTQTHPFKTFYYLLTPVKLEVYTTLFDRAD